MSNEKNKVIEFPTQISRNTQTSCESREDKPPRTPNSQEVVAISIATRVQTIVHRIVEEARVNKNTLHIRINRNKINQLLDILNEAIEESPATLESLGVSIETIGSVIMMNNTLQTAATCSSKLMAEVKKALIKKCENQIASKTTVETLRFICETHKDGESPITRADIAQFAYEATVRESKAHIKKLRAGKCTALYDFFIEIEDEWPTPKTFPGKTHEELKESLSIWEKSRKASGEANKIFVEFGTSIAEISAAIRQELITRSDISNLLYRLIYEGESYLEGGLVETAREKLTEEEVSLIKEDIEKWKTIRESIIPILEACRNGNLKEVPILTEVLNDLPTIHNYGIPYGYVGMTKQEHEALQRRYEMKYPTNH